MIWIHLIFSIRILRKRQPKLTLPTCQKFFINIIIHSDTRNKHWNKNSYSDMFLRIAMYCSIHNNAQVSLCSIFTAKSKFQNMNSNYIPGFISVTKFGYTNYSLLILRCNHMCIHSLQPIYKCITKRILIWFNKTNITNRKV